MGVKDYILMIVFLLFAAIGFVGVVILGTAKVHTYFFHAEKIYITGIAFDPIDDITDEDDLNGLFPEHKEDWIFAQEFAGVSGLIIPKIVWNKGDDISWTEVTSHGYYDSRGNYIDIDKESFATSTVAFSRYVLIHEMLHATLDRSELDVDDDHCYMVKTRVLIEIGQRVGNISLGIGQHKYHKDQCDTPPRS